MRKTFILLLLFSSYFIKSQDFNNYQPLKCQGPIPEDFRKTASEKFESNKTKIKTKEKGYIKKAKETFILESTFYNDLILQSGVILFNDPITNYINKVGDVVLNDFLELRKKIRFYTMKSQVVNAYSSDNGIIFITTGLISQLENEAQLAYIISHEVVHYAKKHQISGYIEKVKMEKGTDNYKKMSNTDKLMLSLKYSKNDEYEADKLGLTDYYKLTNYNYKAVDGVYDVLQFSDLPFDIIPFDKNILNPEYYKINDEYYKIEKKEIDYKEDKDDSESTHPNVKKRREAVNSILNEFNNDGRQFYIVSEDEFKIVRKISRYEVLRQYLLEADYASAIYNSFLLLKEEPESKYIKTAIAFSLYACCEYKCHSTISSVITSYTKVMGEQSELNKMLTKIKKDELLCIATNYIWKTYLANNSDPFLKEIAYGVIKELPASKMSFDDFSLKPPDTNKLKESDTIKVEDDSKKNDSKYSKIKKNKEKGKDKSALGFTLVEVINNQEFATAFKQATESYKEEDEYNKSLSKKAKRKLAKRGASLGVNKIIILDPFYFKYDERKKDKVLCLESEDSQFKLSNLTKESAKKVGITTQVISSKKFDEDEVDLFNDMSFFKEWINERFVHEDLDLISSSFTTINGLAGKYQTNYLYFNGVVNLKLKRHNLAGIILSTVYFPVILPYTIYFCASPEYKTYYYGLLLDLKTGKVKFSVIDNFNYISSNDFLKSIIYDSFNQIKSLKKSK